MTKPLRALLAESMTSLAYWRAPELTSEKSRLATLCSYYSGTDKGRDLTLMQWYIKVAWLLTGRYVRYIQVVLRIRSNWNECRRIEYYAALTSRCLRPRLAVRPLIPPKACQNKWRYKSQMRYSSFGEAVIFTFQLQALRSQ